MRGSIRWRDGGGHHGGTTSTASFEELLAKGEYRSHGQVDKYRRIAHGTVMKSVCSTTRQPHKAKQDRGKMGAFLYR